MFNIQDWVIEIFGPSGEWGIVLCVFIIFLIDGFGIPTLPELFFATLFLFNPTDLFFGLQLLIAAILAEVAGVTILYWVVGHLTVPKRIERVMNKYVDFLILKDERLLLLNRIAPMLPFSGAFVKIAGWDLKKSIMYVVIGCILKYGAILLMSNFFSSYFSSNIAQMVTIGFIIAVIVISFVASTIAKKRLSIEKDQSE